MDLEKLIYIQRQFDAEHGWIERDRGPSLLRFLNRDVVGLAGEVGEFANLLKKINLVADIDEEGGMRARLLRLATRQFASELADVFVYVMRLSSALGIDLESEYKKKLRLNRRRFRRFRLK